MSKDGDRGKLVKQLFVSEDKEFIFVIISKLFQKKLGVPLLSVGVLCGNCSFLPPEENGPTVTDVLASIVARNS